jgi:hypothetical protein
MSWPEVSDTLAELRALLQSCRRELDRLLAGLAEFQRINTRSSAIIDGAMYHPALDLGPYDHCAQAVNPKRNSGRQ